ncbi:MAG: TonB-dependent receptor [Bacteroidaceae bacterium]|nr:TonB-dependent receptor [Bacteroidaceae bacterium]
MTGHCCLRALLLSFTAFVSTTIQGATDTDTLTHEPVSTISEVEIKARRVPAGVSSSAPTQRMTRNQLEALGIQDVTDAVKRMAGAYVRDYGGLGGLKTVSVRSLGASHTAVNYDGVTVSNCQAGQIDVGRFSLEGVEELALTIGQESDPLQPARSYAAAGMLSIRTTRPTFARDAEDSWQVKLSGGSFGYIAPSLRYARRLGEKTALTAFGNFMRADGQYPFTLKNGTQESREKRVNSDIYSWTAEANLFHQFADSSRLTLKGYHYRSERGLPGAIKLYNLEAQYRERLWDENFFAQATYENRFSDTWSLRASAKYNHSWNRYEDKDISYAGGKITDINRQDEYYLSATAAYRPSAYWLVSLAQDGAINQLRSNLPLCPFPTRYTSLTALSARYTVSWMTVNASLLGTYITEEVKQGPPPPDRRRLSPSVGVTFRPLPGERLYLRLLYKDIFRVPTFNDMYYQRVGNKMLKPEKATQYNVGVTYDAPAIGILDYLTLTADAYINRVTDKIVAIPTAYVWKMYNFGKVDITGVDATLATGCRLGGQVELHLSGNYTYQRAVDKSDPSTKYYGDQLPYTPRHMGNMMLQVKLPWVEIGYTLMMVGERYAQTQNIAMNRIDGYHEHTLALSRSFALRGVNLSLRGEWLNLTDEQYEVIKYYPMPGSSWRVSLIASF